MPYSLLGFVDTIEKFRIRIRLWIQRIRRGRLTEAREKKMTNRKTCRPFLDLPPGTVLIAI